MYALAIFAAIAFVFSMMQTAILRIIGVRLTYFLTQVCACQYTDFERIIIYVNTDCCNYMLCSTVVFVYKASHFKGSRNDAYWIRYVTLPLSTKIFLTSA